MIDLKDKLKFLILLIGLILGNLITKAQEKPALPEGHVSYITGQNIYVKYISTEGIQIGDTLYTGNESVLSPALVVRHKSSISCLCEPLSGADLKISDAVFSKTGQSRPVTTEPVIETPQPEKDINEQVLTTQTRIKPADKKQNFTGRLVASSYSNFSKSGDDSHRLRYTFSSTFSAIGDSRFSFETYLSFTHKLHEWEMVRENLNDALKVYSLALNYKVTDRFSIWAGRKINPRIANAGAVDGVQFEYLLKNMFVGAVAGSRPDYYDYGFNPELMEYGVYIGQSLQSESGFVQTSLAFFEQLNKGNVDRRFLYFQHTNSVLKNLNVFTSVELDLFKRVNDEPKNTLSLTGLYLSLNYRFSRKWSANASYDNRKNVIYYETFRNLTDEILTQASRQGIRGRITYRPLNYLMLGASAGTRFTEDDPRKTKTGNAFITWSQIPVLDASLSLMANLMQTAYLDGQIYGARLTRDFSQQLSMMLSYRWVDFNYVNSLSTLIQNIGEVDFSYRFSKNFYLSVNFEATVQREDIYNRLYLSLRKSF